MKFPKHSVYSSSLAPVSQLCKDSQGNGGYAMKTCLCPLTSTDVEPRKPKSCSLNGSPSILSAVSWRYCMGGDEKCVYSSRNPGE